MKKSENKSAKKSPTKTANISQLNAECKKVLKGDTVAEKSNAVFHVYIAALVSLGDTLGFIIESMQKLKFTDDQKSSLKQKIINVRGTWTDDEKKKIVAAATKETGKQQSIESLGIQFSRKRDTVQRSALIKGQEVLAWSTIKWYRVINSLATGDQFAAFPAMKANDSYDGMMKKAFKHCYPYKGKETTLGKEIKNLYTDVDYSDAKAAGNAATAGLIVSRANKMLTNGNKPIAKAFRKFKTELADSFANKRKHAKLLKSATDHLKKLIRDKQGKVKPLAVLKAVAQAQTPETKLTGTVQNRIKQLTSKESNLIDIAKGRGKSDALKKALPTLKS